MKKFIIPVSGMTCASCALRIEESLKDLQSLESVTVNFPLERVEIQADHINLKEIKEKIESIGYDIVSKKTSLCRWRAISILPYTIKSNDSWYIYGFQFSFCSN